MNKIVSVCIALFSLIVPVIVVHAADFIEFDADGEYRLVSNCEVHKEVGKIDFYNANIKNSFLHEDKLFFFDGLLLKQLTLKDGKVRVLKDFEKTMPSSLPWYIGGVQKSKLYFSSYDSISSFKGGGTTPVIKLFEYELNEDSVDELDIGANLGSSYFSVQESKIYFTNRDGDILSYYNGEIESYGVSGAYPEISPDGNRIAYAKSGIIFDSIRVRNLHDGSDLDVIKLPLFMHAQPNIRWSDDSYKVLIGAVSDIRKPIIISADIDGKQECRKKTSSVSWFYYK